MTIKAYYTLDDNYGDDEVPEAASILLVQPNPHSKLASLNDTTIRLSAASFISKLLTCIPVHESSISNQLYLKATSGKPSKFRRLTQWKSNTSLLGLALALVMAHKQEITGYLSDKYLDC